jgi:ABC-type ATPase involved in cell division
MITKLKIKNFKGFKEYEISFDRINLLIGGNNSGKTSIFHALKIFFWCINQTKEITGNNVTFKKTQLPEIGGLPYFSLKDLYYNQKIRTGGKPTRIYLELNSSLTPNLSFNIYPAFSRNVMIDGAHQSITKDELEQLIKLEPIFIPSTGSITVQEELFRPIAQDRMISEGRQNQVLRNIIYRLSEKKTLWDEFKKIIIPLFKLGGIDVPFDDETDEWLTAIYKEGECKFDFISAGSGFLQVTNIIAFLLLNPSKVVLLDEPDSHLHDDLQKLIFEILKKIAESRNSQIIISTHSSTLIDAAEVNSLLLIDKKEGTPLKPKNTDELIPLLSDRGISLPPTKLMSALKGRKILFVEGKESDYNDFIKILGQKIDSEFIQKTRYLTIFETEGASKQWPFDSISAFENLIGSTIEYIYISDRDFNLDVQIYEKRIKAKENNCNAFYLSRRNRESYLLEPRIISKFLKLKWIKKNPGKTIPRFFFEGNLKNFIIKHSSKVEEETRTKLLTYQEPYLRGGITERNCKTLEVNNFFKKNYTEKIKRKKIPYKLLDSKVVLTEIRKEISKKYSISFPDKEILQNFEKNDIPNELKHLIKQILDMFKH